MELKIDKEFESLIPALTQEEFKQLEENVINQGVRDPLVVWVGENVLLDGHNRFKICKEHDVDYGTVGMDLEDRAACIDWIIKNQLGRRNLDPKKAAYLRGKLYEETKKAATGFGDRTLPSVKMTDGQPKATTAKKLAKEHGVSPSTIERDAKFSKAVDKIAEAVGENDEEKHQVKSQILNGEKKITKQEVAQVVNVAQDDPAKIKEAFEAALDVEKKRGKAALLARTATPEINPARLELNHAFKKLENLLNQAKNAAWPADIITKEEVMEKLRNCAEILN